MQTVIQLSLWTLKTVQ